MKKLLFLTILVSLLSTTTYASTPIPVFFGGTQLNLSTSPVLKNGTVLVPFRDIFETLGYSVYYDSSAQRIESKKGGSEIIMFIGSQYANISGTDHTLTVTPQTVKGVTMVPLRFVSEAAGYNVQWQSDNDGNYITIDYFADNKVVKTSEYLKQEDINKTISAYQEQQAQKTEAKNKERQAYQDYQDKKKAILDDYHKTWISKDNMINLHRIYPTWMGEYITFIEASSSKEIFRINGSPKKEFQRGKIYEGNGVRYQYIDTISLPFPEAQDGTGKLDVKVDAIVFSVPDLKAQGVIK